MRAPLCGLKRPRRQGGWTGRRWHAREPTMAGGTVIRPLARGQRGRRHGHRAMEPQSLDGQQDQSRVYPDQHPGHQRVGQGAADDRSIWPPSRPGSKTPLTSTRSGMTWPTPSTRPWNPRTFRCGSTTAIEANAIRPTPHSDGIELPRQAAPAIASERPILFSRAIRAGSWPRSRDGALARPGSWAIYPRWINWAGCHIHLAIPEPEGLASVIFLAENYPVPFACRRCIPRATG